MIIEKQQLQQLAKLHKLDVECAELSGAQSAIEIEVNELRQMVADLDASLERQRESLAETTKLRKSQEAELKIKEDLIGRAKAKMAAVSNSRSYMAAEREVESARRDTQMIEEQVLALIDTEEQGRAALDERVSKLDELKAQIEADVSSQLSMSEQNLVRLEELSALRVGVLEGVEKRPLKVYDRLIERYKSHAMAEARDNGDVCTCSACRHVLPPQLYNIIVRSESLETCPHCKRILYHDSILN